MAETVYTVEGAFVDSMASCNELIGRWLHDFGEDADFYEMLKLLVEDLNDSHTMPETSSRAKVYKILVRDLCYRLQILDLLKHNAEELKNMVMPRIVMVTSNVLSGSTFLHNLLYTGQGEGKARALLKWESLVPSPLAEPGKCRTDPRIPPIIRVLRKSYNTMHFIDADEPEETIFFSHDLWGFAGRSLTHFTPRLVEYIQSPVITRRAFSNYREIIKLFCLHNPPAPGASLVLKCPQDTPHISVFADVFPEAKIVLLHRDPFRVFDSGFHLLRLYHYGIVGHKLDNEAMKSSLLEAMGSCMKAMIDFADARPQDVVNVFYDKLIEDPVLETVRILKETGHNTLLEEETVACIRAFLAEQEKGKRGKPASELSSALHRCTQSSIHKHFQDYIDFFRVPTEGVRKVGVHSRF